MDARLGAGVEHLASALRALAPSNDEQTYLKSRALDLAESMLESRWTVFANTPSVPLPFVSIVIGWLAVIFASFGLFAPRNATVIAILGVCAVSVACAVFLVLELDGPFNGWIRVSRAPMDYALAQLGT